jgi:(1->4)-alpha-D-glucan 1-alpha-D-glucosylmutase
LRDCAAEHGAHAFDAALRGVDPRRARSRACLHHLLEGQHHRLAWRTAADELNWRRFFDIATLAAVRVEDEAVFEAHAAAGAPCGGLVDGLRVDHVDGLADPRAYCRRLHARLAAQRDERPFLVVEKILAPGETLPDDWHADGTTGYDFMNDVAALLHDRPAPSRSPALGRRVGRRAPSPTRRSPVAAAPRQLAGEHARLARALHRIARAAPATRDISRNALHRVLGELAVHLPVYRMYPALGDEPGDADRRVLERAYDAARAATDPSDRCARARRRLARAARHPRAARRSGRALARRVRAAQRAACREGRRGYGELPLRPAAVAQRGRRRRGRLQPVARRVPRAQPASRAQRAAHARRHRDARSQARRRRACAARGAERSARRVARGVARLVGAEPAASRRRASRSRVDAGAGGRGHAVSDAGGLLAADARARRRGGRRRAGRAWWAGKRRRCARRSSTPTGSRPMRTTNARASSSSARSSRRAVRAIFCIGCMRRRADRPAGVVNSLAQVALRIASPGVPDLYQGTELWITLWSIPTTGARCPRSSRPSRSIGRSPRICATGRTRA